MILIDMFSLLVIVTIAIAAPAIAHVIPGRPIPETVLLLVGGMIFGSFGLNYIVDSDAINLLSQLGLAFLFLIAGTEINPKVLAGKEGRRGLLTWGITMVLALGMAFGVSVYTQNVFSLPLAIAFTTTALGALLPILKERGLMETRIGEGVLAYGTWGELGPVLVMAALLSSTSTWLTSLILGLIFIFCVIVAVAFTRGKEHGSRITNFLSDNANTTSQTMVRLVVFLLVLLVAVTMLFDIDVVIGAFACGFLIPYLIPKGESKLMAKLEGIGYGFFIPIFFVVSGCSINLTAVVANIPLLIAFVLLLLAIRGVLVFIALHTGEKTRDLPTTDQASISLYCTTALPLIVAVTTLAVDAGTMSQGLASILVAAGVVTMLVMPIGAKLASDKGKSQAVSPILEKVLENEEKQLGLASPTRKKDAESKTSSDAPSNGETHDDGKIGT